MHVWVIKWITYPSYDHQSNAVGNNVYICVWYQASIIDGYYKDCHNFNDDCIPIRNGKDFTRRKIWIGYILLITFCWMVVPDRA